MKHVVTFFLVILLVGCTKTGKTTITKDQGPKGFGDGPCGIWCQKGVDLGCGTPTNCEVKCLDVREQDELTLGADCTAATDALLSCVAEDPSAVCDGTFASAACTAESDYADTACQPACTVTDDATCDACVEHHCCAERDACSDDACVNAVGDYDACTGTYETCQAAAAKASAKAGAFLACAHESCQEVCQ